MEITKFDYATLLHTQLAMVQQLHAQNWQFYSATDDARYIAEFCTVGFKMPRQTGMYKFVVDFTAEHMDSTIVIFKDGTMRKYFAGRLEDEHQLQLADCETMPMFSLLEQNVKSKGRLPNFDFYAKHPEIAKGIKHIILSEAGTLFSYCGLKRKEFCKLVADVFGTKIAIIEVG